MPRTALRPPAIDEQLLLAIFASGADAVNRDEQLAMLQMVRCESAEHDIAIDQWLLDFIERQRAGLEEIRDQQTQLRTVLAEMSATPWQPAIFLGRVASGDVSAASVTYGNTVRVVGLAHGVSIADLAPGDEVLLARDLNVVMRKAPFRSIRASDTAEVVRVLSDGRLLVSQNNEELVVLAAASLATDTLAAGDRVLWDRNVALAFEKIEKACDSDLFLSETPREGFDEIGGLSVEIALLQRSLRLHMLHPDVVRRYHLKRTGSVLLFGPPGTGKTLMARALAAWLGERSPAGRAHFVSIKPGALHSHWYSQSEANYREVFRKARDIGAAHPEMPVVLFFDEVDAIGAARGEGVTRVDDRVLTAFMAELDGLEARGNILVVAATNRRDAVDPALLRPGRLGDLVIEIPRPGMTAAAAILGKHLPTDIPYAGVEDDEGRRRSVIIDAAVSRLYAPNAEGEVAAITFRDGTRRGIQARELVSGAMLAKVARVAVERACLREIEGGPSGVDATDILDAVADEVDSAVSGLTPMNCHAFVSGLPQDLTAVRVEAARRKTTRAYRYVGTPELPR
jgi:proteasome-associated ATPase